MMYEGKHIHYSPVDNKPLCSYSTKLCKQRRLNGYAFCIRHILEDKSAPFKQCAHVAKYNNQKCTNPIPTNEEREYCNSHMQVAGMAPKKERKAKKVDKDASSPDGKLKFADRLKALLKTNNEVASSEDQVSVDDPYAFSESASETSTEKSPSGSVSSSPNSHEPVCGGNNRVIVDQLPNKLTTVSSTSASTSTTGNGDNKVSKVNSTAKSSKTMNRLQAKIAQNKILDKLKKNQDAVGYVSNSNVFQTKVDGLHSNGTDLSFLDVQQRVAPCASLMKKNVSSLPAGDLVSSIGKNICESNNVNNNHLNNTNNVNNNNNCGSSNGNCGASKNLFQSFHQTGLFNVSVPPKKLWRSKVKKNSVDTVKKQVPDPVQRVQDIWNRRRLYTTDLYPLGIELSDSESDDNESESLQRHWFYTWDKGDTLQVNSEFLPNSRPARLSVRQSEMRRQYNQLCSAHTASETERKFQRDLVSALLRSTKRYPNRTADVVHSMQPINNQLVKNKNYSGVVKRYCCYKNEKESCGSAALPHTRHCVKHIMYNVDQLLFEHCTAKFADNTQCCVPVFDICHELPLCTEHARKRDNYNKMSAEPKPKKPRKKTKPSALTRPPKRGKKKKRQNGIRPNKQSTSHISALSAETASTDVPSSISLGLDASHMSPGPTELNADDISKGLEDNLDDDLADQLSPGSIEKSLELPLDTAELANQASRLLEEHDFTEVLNKIPDDAFNDLFTESKNGDFLPTKEETEELERALAAVDKDVKSLEKLSGDNNDDMSELDLQESLLHAGTDHGIDDHALGELAPTSMSMDNLNVITSSLSTNDLNSISQVLSTITTDSMVPNPMPAGLVDNAILQSPIPGVQLLPDLVQGPLQLQVPVNATQSANFVLSPHLLGATFTTTTAGDPTTSVVTQGSFGNGSTISTFPQTVAHTIPLATPEGISISLQSQLQGIRTGQWILSPADQTNFTPMVYQNGFPLTTQPFTGQVSTIGNLKLPFPTTSVDVLKQSADTELMSMEQCPTFITVNGGGIGASNAFPVANCDSPKETVS